MFPFLWTDLSDELCDGCAERGEAVQDGDTNLELRNLTVEVTRHETLTQKLYAVHLCFDAAPAVISFGAALGPVAGWPLTIFARWFGRSAVMRAGLRFGRLPRGCRASRAWRSCGAV